MKDLATGLPIASIQHLPQQLQDALLRGQRNVTPLLYFVETARKLSQSATRRYEKERLIVVTPDSLNVYGMDGAIKRRVKIAEISAVLFTKMVAVQTAQQGGGGVRKLDAAGSASASSAGWGGASPRAVTISSTTAASASSSTTPAVATTTTSTASTVRKMVASVGLRVPAQYDLAFDLTSRGDNAGAYSPDLIVSNLIRVIGVLQSQSAAASAGGGGATSTTGATSRSSSTTQRSGGGGSTSVPSLLARPVELRVVQVGGPEGAAKPPPKQLWEYLALKKTPLSGRVPAGSSLSSAAGSSSRHHHHQQQQQQLLAPILPLVTDEAERQKQLDARLQVDEAIAELLDQLERYTNDSVAAKTVCHVTRLDAYANHMQAMEHLEYKLQTKERWLANRSDRINTRQQELQTHISRAREAQLGWIRKMETLRSVHHDTVRMIRADVSDCDARGTELESKIHDSEETQVRELHVSDMARRALEVQLGRSHEVLESREDLPSAAALQDEIFALLEAAERLRASLATERARVAKEAEIAGLRVTMLDENATLETDVAAAMASVRAAKDSTQQLTLKVSLALAKRNRLARSCETFDEAVRALAADCVALETHQVLQQRAVDGLTEERELLQSEQLVVNDMAREALMHDSITASVATIAITDEKMKVASETNLKEQLEKLRRLKQGLEERVRLSGN